MSRPDVRLPREVDHPWHVAINKHADGAGYPEMRFMYHAKAAAEEVPRLALLFGMERRGELPQHHHQCSHDHAGEPVPDNHLTCCLGMECRKCPHLAVIDGVKQGYKVEVSDEQRDVMKAWTCATHILMSGGDSNNEGFILTTDDRMYWDNVYESLSQGDPEPQEPR